MGLWVIAAVSFFESALPVPIITDPFMVAGILADRSKAVYIVLLTIVSSILGGIAAFTTAVLFFDVVADQVTTYIATQLPNAVPLSTADALITTLTGAITPIPYTIVAWVVAVAGGALWVFLLGSIIGRTIRYAVVGYCAWKFGPVALERARQSLWVTSAAVLLFVGLYIWLKL